MTDDFLIGFKTAEKLKNGSIGWSAFKSELNYSYLFSDCKFPRQSQVWTQIMGAIRCHPAARLIP